MQTFNWGIIAPGNIAAKFAQALQSVESANLYSVASRTPDKAEQFAKEYKFTKVAQSYVELVSDPQVDVVYIASPHNLHCEQSLLCLQAGKAVLCEKPMAVNSAQAAQVLSAAKQNNVFYMEAVWSRFLPVFDKVREWLDSGAIGEVKHIQANFGFRFPDDPKSRLYDANLAGGSLLDLGIYPITYAQWVMGDQQPEVISALGQLGATGVDENLAIILKYQGGALATLTSSMLVNTDYDGWIVGTEGKIRAPLFWCGESAELITGHRTDWTVIDSFEQKHQCNGYEGEIREVHRCLAAGLTESPSLPFSTSAQVMSIMDEVRQQIGLVYPFE